MDVSANKPTQSTAPLMREVRASLRIVRHASVAGSKLPPVNHLKDVNGTGQGVAKPFRLVMERVERAAWSVACYRTVAGGSLRMGKDVAVVAKRWSLGPKAARWNNRCGGKGGAAR